MSSTKDFLWSKLLKFENLISTVIPTIVMFVGLTFLVAIAVIVFLTKFFIQNSLILHNFIFDKLDGLQSYLLRSKEEKTWVNLLKFFLLLTVVKPFVILMLILEATLNYLDKAIFNGKNWRDYKEIFRIEMPEYPREKRG
jgi:hypothetical protein